MFSEVKYLLKGILRVGQVIDINSDDGTVTVLDRKDKTTHRISQKGVTSISSRGRIKSALSSSKATLTPDKDDLRVDPSKKVRGSGGGDNTAARILTNPSGEEFVQLDVADPEIWEKASDTFSATFANAPIGKRFDNGSVIYTNTKDVPFDSKNFPDGITDPSQRSQLAHIAVSNALIGNSSFTPNEENARKAFGVMQDDDGNFVQSDLSGAFTSKQTAGAMLTNTQTKNALYDNVTDADWRDAVRSVSALSDSDIDSMYSESPSMARYVKARRDSIIKWGYSKGYRNSAESGDGPINADDFTPVNDNQLKNPTTGEVFDIVEYGNADEAKNASLSSALRRAAGEEAAVERLAYRDGKLVSLRDTDDSATNYISSPQSTEGRLWENYGVDAWLDSRGYTDFNTRYTTDGTPVREDFSGDILYSPGHKKKRTNFETDMSAFSDLRKPDASKAGLERAYEDITDAQAKESLERVSKVSDTDIEDIVTSIYGEGDEANKLIHDLKVRRDAAGSYMATVDPANTKRNLGKSVAKKNAKTASNVDKAEPGSKITIGNDVYLKKTPGTWSSPEGRDISNDDMTTIAQSKNGSVKLTPKGPNRQRPARQSVSNNNLEDTSYLHRKGMSRLYGGKNYIGNDTLKNAPSGSVIQIDGKDWKRNAFGRWSDGETSLSLSQLKELSDQTDDVAAYIPSNKASSFMDRLSRNGEVAINFAIDSKEDLALLRKAGKESSFYSPLDANNRFTKQDDGTWLAPDGSYIKDTDARLGQLIDKKYLTDTYGKSNAAILSEVNNSKGFITIDDPNYSELPIGSSLHMPDGRRAFQNSDGDWVDANGDVVDAADAVSASIPEDNIPTNATIAGDSISKDIMDRSPIDSIINKDGIEYVKKDSQAWEDKDGNRLTDEAFGEDDSLSIPNNQAMAPKEKNTDSTISRQDEGPGQMVVEQDEVTPDQSPSMDIGEDIQPVRPNEVKQKIAVDDTSLGTDDGKNMSHEMFEAFSQSDGFELKDGELLVSDPEKAQQTLEFLASRDLIDISDGSGKFIAEQVKKLSGADIIEDRSGTREATGVNVPSKTLLQGRLLNSTQKKDNGFYNEGGGNYKVTDYDKAIDTLDNLAEDTEGLSPDVAKQYTDAISDIRADIRKKQLANVGLDNPVKDILPVQSSDVRGRINTGLNNYQKRGIDTGFDMSGNDLRVTDTKKASGYLRRLANTSNQPETKQSIRDLAYDIERRNDILGREDLESLDDLSDTATGLLEARYRTNLASGKDLGYFVGDDGNIHISNKELASRSLQKEARSAIAKSGKAVSEDAKSDLRKSADQMFSKTNPITENVDTPEPSGESFGTLTPDALTRVKEGLLNYKNNGIDTGFDVDSKGDLKVTDPRKASEYLRRLSAKTSPEVKKDLRNKAYDLVNTQDIANKDIVGEPVGLTNTAESLLKARYRTGVLNDKDLGYFVDKDGNIKISDLDLAKKSFEMESHSASVKSGKAVSKESKNNLQQAAKQLNNKDAIKRNGESNGESKSDGGRGESNLPTSESDGLDKGTDSEGLRRDTRGSDRSDGVDSQRNEPVTFGKTDDYQAFTDAISEIKKTPVGAAVYVHDAEDYKDMDTYLTPSGGAGYALEDGDNLVSVFNTGKDGKRLGNKLVQDAVNNGAKRLDAYDPMLTKMYATNGFRPVARMKWNDEYADPNWDYDKLGRPDVVFMAYDKNRVGSIYDPTEGDYIDDYDKGLDLAKKYARGELSFDDNYSVEEFQEALFKFTDENPDVGDRITAFVEERNGLGGKPEVISPKEFDSLDDSRKLYRGSNDDTYGQYTGDKNYVGTGGTGSGTYTSNYKSRARSHGENVVELYLKDDANIIDGNTLEKMRQKSLEDATNDVDRFLAEGDLARYAASKGYDGYTVDPFDKFGDDEKYTILTNRAATLVRGESTPSTEKKTAETGIPTSLEEVGVKRTEPVKLDGEKYAPTREQQDVIDSVLAGKDTIVQALAGSGKTSTVQAIAKRLPEDKKAIYIAFNRSVADEAKGKLPKNTEALTGHALALKWARTSDYSEILKRGPGGKGFKYTNAKAIAKHLDISDKEMTVSIEKKDGGSELKSLDGVGKYFAARKILENYQRSDRDKITEKDLLDSVYDVPNENDRKELLGIAEKLWNDRISNDGKTPVEFDTYRKLWAMSEPDLSKESGLGKRDILFIDEAQDTPPVLSKLINSQKNIQKVVVGDSDQSIYGFSGNEDFLSKADGDVELFLTNSFRFGKNIADVGNNFLNLKNKKFPDNKVHKSIVGTDADSLVDKYIDNPDAILVRRNATLISVLNNALGEGKENITVPTGTRTSYIKMVMTAKALKEGDIKSLSKSQIHPDMDSYSSWGALVADQKRGNDKVNLPFNLFNDMDANQLGEIREQLNKVYEPLDRKKVRIDTKKNSSNMYALSLADSYGVTDINDWERVGKYGDLYKSTKAGDAKKVEDLMDEIETSYDNSDLAISTAHKAKGLEWDRVQLAEDFPNDPDKANEDELKLLYVAATRGRKAVGLGSAEWGKGDKDRFDLPENGRDRLKKAEGDANDCAITASATTIDSCPFGGDTGYTVDEDDNSLKIHDKDRAKETIEDLKKDAEKERDESKDEDERKKKDEEVTNLENILDGLADINWGEDSDNKDKNSRLGINWINHLPFGLLNGPDGLNGMNLPSLPSGSKAAAAAADAAGGAAGAAGNAASGAANSMPANMVSNILQAAEFVPSTFAFDFSFGNTPEVENAITPNLNTPSASMVNPYVSKEGLGIVDVLGAGAAKDTSVVNIPNVGRRTVSNSSISKYQGSDSNTSSYGNDNVSNAKTAWGESISTGDIVEIASATSTGSKSTVSTQKMRVIGQGENNLIVAPAGKSIQDISPADVSTINAKAISNLDPTSETVNSTKAISGLSANVENIVNDLVDNEQAFDSSAIASNLSQARTIQGRVIETSRVKSAGYSNTSVVPNRTITGTQITADSLASIPVSNTALISMEDSDLLTRTDEGFKSLVSGNTISVEDLASKMSNGVNATFIGGSTASGLTSSKISGDAESMNSLPNGSRVILPGNRGVATKTGDDLWKIDSNIISEDYPTQGLSSTYSIDTDSLVSGAELSNSSLTAISGNPINRVENAKVGSSFRTTDGSIATRISDNEWQITSSNGVETVTHPSVVDGVSSVADSVSFYQPVNRNGKYVLGTTLSDPTTGVSYTVMPNGLLKNNTSNSMVKLEDAKGLTAASMVIPPTKEMTQAAVMQGYASALPVGTTSSVFTGDVTATKVAANTWAIPDPMNKANSYLFTDKEFGQMARSSVRVPSTEGVNFAKAAGGRTFRVGQVVSVDGIEDNGGQIVKLSESMEAAYVEYPNGVIKVIPFEKLVFGTPNPMPNPQPNPNPMPNPQPNPNPHFPKNVAKEKDIKSGPYDSANVSEKSNVKKVTEQVTQNIADRLKLIQENPTNKNNAGIIVEIKNSLGSSVSNISSPTVLKTASGDYVNSHKESKADAFTNIGAITAQEAYALQHTVRKAKEEDIDKATGHTGVGRGTPYQKKLRFHKSSYYYPILRIEGDVFKLKGTDSSIEEVRKDTFETASKFLQETIPVKKFKADRMALTSTLRAYGTPGYGEAPADIKDILEEVDAEFVNNPVSFYGNTMTKSVSFLRPDGTPVASREELRLMVGSLISDPGYIDVIGGMDVVKNTDPANNNVKLLVRVAANSDILFDGETIILPRGSALYIDQVDPAPDVDTVWVEVVPMQWVPPMIYDNTIVDDRKAE